MSKRLTINGLVKIQGWVFYNRFVLQTIDEGVSSYRWGFKDKGSKHVRMIWIELNRNGEWDEVERKWMYRLNYPKIPGEHRVSGKWWSDLDNVKSTFSKILERNL